MALSKHSRESLARGLLKVSQSLVIAKEQAEIAAYTDRPELLDQAVGRVQDCINTINTLAKEFEA